MADGIKTTGIDHKKHKSKIEALRKKLKESDVVKDVFKKYDLSIDEIDLIPMCFADIEVSARTDRGVIYFSKKMLEDGFDDDDHYGAHEVTHYCQQTTGDKPTQGADDGEYLENPAEIEGFQVQNKYLEDTKGKGTAKEYTNHVLDHHDYEGKKREEKKEELLDSKASLAFRQMQLKLIAG